MELFQGHVCFMDSFAMDLIIKTVPLNAKLRSSLGLQISYQCLDPAQRNAQFFEKNTKFGHKEKSFSAFHSETDILLGNVNFKSQDQLSETMN